MGSKDLYIIQCSGTGDVKIGVSQDVGRRLKELQTGCPRYLKVLLVLKGRWDLERPFHNLLRQYGLMSRNTPGEWFIEEALVHLPDWVYEQLDLENQDWWRGR